MTLAQKHGFALQILHKESPTVSLFFTKHLEELGYPLDTKPQGDLWVGVTKNDRVYCVFGTVREPNGKLNISDFYCWKSRLGQLAAYVAIEEIKIYADQTKLPMVVMSRWDNEPMNRAIERTFGNIVTHVIYQYNQ